MLPSKKMQNSYVEKIVNYTKDKFQTIWTLANKVFGPKRMGMNIVWWAYRQAILNSRKITEIDYKIERWDPREAVVKYNKSLQTRWVTQNDLIQILIKGIINNIDSRDIID